MKEARNDNLDLVIGFFVLKKTTEKEYQEHKSPPRDNLRVNVINEIDKLTQQCASLEEMCKNVQATLE